MDLTLRQKTFLSTLIDLCIESAAPVHYSTVAQKLGVNKFTAYDMLKVLEQKKLVTSEYHHDTESNGPGRSSILFVPTARARRLITRLGGSDVSEPAEWPQVKARILSRLKHSSGTRVEESINELAGRMRQGVPPLVYCAEVLSALILSLTETYAKYGDTNPLKAILSTHWRFNLNLLAGLALGTSGARPTVELTNRIGEIARRYETAIQQLSAERQETLREFVDEMLNTWDLKSWERQSAGNEA